MRSSVRSTGTSWLRTGRPSVATWTRGTARCRFPSGSSTPCGNRLRRSAPCAGPWPCAWGECEPLEAAHETQQGRPLLRRQPQEPVARTGSLAGVELDRRFNRQGAAVVQEDLFELDSHERLGSELRRRRLAKTDVRQLRAHVVE